jgi:hypothetical protein
MSITIREISLGNNKINLTTILNSMNRLSNEELLNYINQLEEETNGLINGRISLHISQENDRLKEKITENLIELNQYTLDQLRILV